MLPRSAPLVLALALLFPGLAFAQSDAASGGDYIGPLNLEYRLQLPDLREQADGDLSEMSIDERRALQKRLKLRRKMVEVHQVFAITTAASIVGANVVGLINRGAIDSGTPSRSELEPPLALHRVLAGTALTSYLAAGITAWTMPPALRLHKAQEGKKKLDSGDLHVAFSIVHGIAMATVMATGILQANVEPAGRNWDALVATHTVAGLTAASFVIAGGITIGTL